MERKKYLKPDVELISGWVKDVLDTSIGNGVYLETGGDGQYINDFFTPTI